MESEGGLEDVPAGGRVREGAFDAVEAVVRDGFVEGMYRRLQAKFPDLPGQAFEDALYVAAERCAQRPDPPDNVRAWMFAVARNVLIDELRRRPTESFDPDDPGHERGAAPSAEDEVVAADEAARADAAYRKVVERVESWPTVKLRTVVLLVLTAAHEGVPLSNGDLASMAGALLGEEMSPTAAAVSKSRGLARLRHEYPDILPEQRPGA